MDKVEITLELENLEFRLNKSQVLIWKEISVHEFTEF